MTDNEDAAKEQAEHYAEAVAKMTDQGLLDRVRTAHPHAAASKEATDAMVADYERLKGEHDKAAKSE